MAVVYSLCVAGDQLKTLLGSLESQFGWAILENVLDLQFLSVGQEPSGILLSACDLTLYERGRAFGEQMEVRWRRKRDHYVVLLLAEAELDLSYEAAVQIEALPAPTPLRQPENDPFLQVALWGERQDPKAEPELPSTDRSYWYEARIPRFLAYPWKKPGKRLVIEVARYRVQSQERDEGPANFLYRFVRLRETPASWTQEQDGVAVNAEGGVET